MFCMVWNGELLGGWEMVEDCGECEEREKLGLLIWICGCKIRQTLCVLTHNVYVSVETR